jgi:hypothetical protein
VASLRSRAEATRREAERSRTRSTSLRLELRRQVSASEQQVARLQATMSDIERRRHGHFRTAWSNLLWRFPTIREENVLELIDR